MERQVSEHRIVRVTPEELAVIRRVLARVPLDGHDQPDLIRPVAVALLDGDDLCFGVGNGWQVASGAWCDVKTEAPAEEKTPTADGRIDLRAEIEEAWAHEQGVMYAKLACGLRPFGDPPPTCAECGAEVVMTTPPPGANLLEPNSRLRCSADPTHEHGCKLRMETTSPPT
jgi:hypothetical protein